MKKKHFKTKEEFISFLWKSRIKLAISMQPTEIRGELAHELGVDFDVHDEGRKEGQYVGKNNFKQNKMGNFPKQFPCTMLLSATELKYSNLYSVTYCYSK